MLTYCHHHSKNHLAHFIALTKVLFNDHLHNTKTPIVSSILLEGLNSQCHHNHNILLGVCVCVCVGSCWFFFRIYAAVNPFLRPYLRRTKGLWYFFLRMLRRRRRLDIYYWIQTNIYLVHHHKTSAIDGRNMMAKRWIRIMLVACQKLWDESCCICRGGGGCR